MHVAIILVLIALGSVAFHIWSPFWWTEIASNWGYVDGTIILTFWITGLVFVAVLLFTAYCVVRFRHRGPVLLGKPRFPGFFVSMAGMGPESQRTRKRLDWWLVEKMESFYVFSQSGSVDSFAEIWSVSEPCRPRLPKPRKA